MKPPLSPLSRESQSSITADEKKKQIGDVNVPFGARHSRDLQSHFN